MENLYAVIMAGGVGERFWPLSTQTHPKQFLDVFTGEPMLLSTARRIAPMVPPARVVVVTNKAYERKSGALFKGKNRPRVIGEPVGKNTAPAIAAAAAAIERENPDGIMAVLSADHLITPEKNFLESIELAAETAAEQDILLCLGVQPTWAHTGLGYIEAGEHRASKGGSSLLEVRCFVEKPDADKARAFLEAGNFLWNCGIFVWSVSSILKALLTHMPGLMKDLEPARKAKTEAAFRKALDGFYRKTAKESIDYGVLEKSKNIAVVKSPIQWSDVGSWTVFRDLSKPDVFGNVLKGNIVDLDSRNCFMLADKGLTATYGLTDLFVIRNGDKVLVIHKDKVPEIKKLIEKMKETGNGGFLS